MGPFVHKTLTREWAVEIGLGEIADEIAEANDEVDRRWPGRRVVFAPLHLGLPALLAAWWSLARARRRRSPRLLGLALHCVQDYHTHGLLGGRHYRWVLGLARDDPDDWEAAPRRIKRRIGRSSRRYLRAYARLSG